MHEKTEPASKALLDLAMEVALRKALIYRIQPCLPTRCKTLLASAEESVGCQAVLQTKACMTRNCEKGEEQDN